MKQKVIDIDSIFDQFITEYIQQNKGKFSEEEWENKICNLYEKFGHTKLSELDNLTPETYYNGLSGKQLCDLLEQHIEQSVSVSDFLCKALISSDCEKYLVRFISNEYDEELVSYCINILNDKNSTVAFDKYFELMFSNDTCEDMKEMLCESLSNNADFAKERALKEYSSAVENDKLYLLEILSNCKHDDRILTILTNELFSHKNDIPLFLSYITKYNDEQILPQLLQLIEDENIDYLAFKELQLAIESFGGEYTKERDFSRDKFYKKIKGAVDESKIN